MGILEDPFYIRIEKGEDLKKDVNLFKNGILVNIKEKRVFWTKKPKQIIKNTQNLITYKNIPIKPVKTLRNRI